jgi:hypothetical protein
VETYGLIKNSWTRRSLGSCSYKPPLAQLVVAEHVGERLSIS